MPGTHKRTSEIRDSALDTQSHRAARAGELNRASASRDKDCGPSWCAGRESVRRVPPLGFYRSASQQMQSARPTARRSTLSGRSDQLFHGPNVAPTEPEVEADACHPGGVAGLEVADRAGRGATVDHRACGYAVIAVGGRHVQGLGLDADVARKRKLGAEAADPTPAPVIADAEGFCGEAWEHIRDAMARI